ncbi:MAG TPA: helix-turn-helix domain-containing protein [Pyrinomonadaceae bacterium]
MNQSRLQADRVFLRAHFALHYRRAARTRLVSDARADYVALFQLSGHLSSKSGNDSFELKEGDAILLEPGMSVTAHGRDVEYVQLTFSPSYILERAALAGMVGAGASVNFRAPFVGQDRRLARFARDLAQELMEEEAGQEIVLGALVEQLTVYLLRHHSNVRRSEELELSRVGLVDRRIRRAIELMHAHMNRELPLEEIAAAAYLSPFHFARLFKKLTGTSPHAYLGNLRVARSQSLLAETDLSISEVSARVGYSSPSHFTKAFRQTTGLTPRAFRKAVVSGQ